MSGRRRGTSRAGRFAADPRTLAKYVGREQALGFLALHGRRTLAASA